MRRALRALDELAKRPSLQTDEARARLTRWFEGLEREERMPNRPTKGTPLAIRFDAETLERLDEAVARLSRPGLDLTRADVLRMAVAEGLLVLLGEARTSPPGGPSSRRGAVAPTLTRSSATRKRRDSE